MGLGLLCDEENVLELEVVMVAQPCDYTKKH